ncbi:aspartate/glutamate racemase family protein [Psychromicrobium xiongbiense]|uniref:aspartate/glutamate racemase family protein n=1 Tax=Psychromicrobium xiongbiense TaxID=3051184 RepID=UPI0025524A6F|nr:aspartate/glutamate racemase family protein [Psychromicrobium sp. YIM S02556]
MTRLGFLHTSPVHVATFDALLATAHPDSPALHLIDESLLADAQTSGPEAVAGRVAEQLKSLHQQGADLVCCTCSTIGDVAERADLNFPVIRVDRPMAVAAVAVSISPRIGVVAALNSTLEPTRALLAEVAAEAKRDVEISLVTASGAWAQFESGDLNGYHASIEHAARTLADSVDVIVLAQASMAGAERRLTDLTIPVLSSPRVAIDFLTRSLHQSLQSEA